MDELRREHLKDSIARITGEKDLTGEEWLRRETSPWADPPSRHCFSHLYFDHNVELTQTPQVPKFISRSPKGEAGWINEVKFAKEVREDIVSQLNQGGSHGSDALNSLADAEKDYRRRAEELAHRIDKLFKTEDPVTGKPTTTVDQAESLLDDLERKLSEHGKVQMNEVFDAESEKRNWRFRKEISGRAWHAAKSNDSMSDFLDQKERPCFGVRKLGYACDLDYLPADAPVDTVAELVFEYLAEIRPYAHKLGRSQALMSYKRMVIQYIVTECRLYGSTEEWEENQIIRDREREINAENYLVDIYLLIDAIKDVLSSNKRSVWHRDKDGTPPNKTGLYRALKKHKKGPLEKKRGGTITKNRLGEIVDENLTDTEIKNCKRKAGIQA